MCWLKFHIHYGSNSYFGIVQSLVLDQKLAVEFNFIFLRMEDDQHEQDFVDLNIQGTTYSAHMSILQEQSASRSPPYGEFSDDSFPERCNSGYRYEGDGFF